MRTFRAHIDKKIKPLREYSNLFRIGLLVIFALAVFLVARNLNNTKKEENIFLRSLNLKLSLKVNKVIPTNNHGYGVIIGDLTSSNKSQTYLAAYKGKYVFCKIIGTRVLFVSDYYVMEKGDSVIINSNVAKYWVYRKRQLVSEYNLTNTTDDFLYSDIEKHHYLDFDNN